MHSLLALAPLAAIVCDSLALDELLKALVESGFLLNLKANVREVVWSFVDTAAPIAYYLTGESSAIDLLNQVCKWRLGECQLHLRMEEAQEFMGVLLDVGGCRQPRHLHVLEELSRLEVSTLRELQIGEQPLQLIHESGGWLFQGHYAFPERLAAVHLLQDGIHVAGGSQVAEPHKPDSGADR